MTARLTLILMASLYLTACSSAAPQAPLGTYKRPANSPETVGELSKPQAGRTDASLATSGQ
ncbi:hypothetical protein [Asticcacaulis tiandongensis]|uniref:hypothetical protein n=1 Tax=Asticcacaulis tiandongensis TaxID=2565365 RepID=UPI001129C9FC|nr:hypothetical protein [Asticcacaulis tiandongensis]